MTLPKTILVPTDFGDASSAATDQAIALAKQLGAELILMHAFEVPVVGFPDGALAMTADTTRRMIEGAREALAREGARCEAAGVKDVETVIEQGDASRAILRVADKVGAGLIVLGTHGRKGLSRALLGSVAEKVVRMAEVPVLTVRARDRA